MSAQGGPPRRILRPLLAAVLACAVSAAIGVPAAAADEADWLYDPNTVVEVHLGLGQAEIEELEAVPDDHVKGTFEARVGGVRKGPALTDVGIRLKGGTSFRELDEKPAFKVKFDKFVDDQLYFGLEGITLNNMVQDGSMIHEALSYDLFRAMGVPAPRSGYTFTRLNGEVLGLHANVEQYDDISLPVLFESTQHLYEADLFNVDVYPGGAGDFEVDEGDDEDLSDLEALIAAANDEVGDWSDGMAAVADLEEMTRMWAVERYIGHWDGYAGAEDPPGFEIRPNNYYLHSDDNGVFQMAPWGTDQTWEDHLGFAETAGGLMFNKCFADSSCKALYDEALEDIQQVTATLELKSKAKRYAELLAPCQALEEESRREWSASQIAAKVEIAQKFVAERYIPLREYLENTPPPLQPETANPPTEEPCTPDPPEDPPGGDGSGSTPPSVAGPVTRAATPKPPRIGKTKAKGSKVFTRLTVSGAGTATQTVRAKAKGKWKISCRGKKSRKSAGPLTVSCRLADWAKRLAEKGSLRLKVRVGFAPRSGKAKFLNRSVTLSKIS